VKRKLVKRPLREYGFGKKGDVYGYDWDPGCFMSLIGLGFSVASLVLAPPGGAALLVASLGTSASLHGTLFSCFE